MMRALPLLILLAGCGGGVINESLPRDSGPDAEACRADVMNDRELRNIASALTPNNPFQNDRVRRELHEAIQRAYNTCMVRRGARAMGGVEPVRRSGW